MENEKLNSSHHHKKSEIKELNNQLFGIVFIQTNCLLSKNQIKYTESIHFALNMIILFIDYSQLTIKSNILEPEIIEMIKLISID